MYCSKCGTKNEDTAVFCMNSGNSLQQPTQPTQPIANPNTMGAAATGGAATITNTLKKMDRKILIIAAAVVGVILAAIIIGVVVSAVGGDGSGALVGTWRLTAYVDYDGDEQSVKKNNYQLTLYKDGSVCDDDYILVEEFDSDGEIVSWSIVDDGVIKFKDDYGDQYYLEYKIKSGTLIFDNDEYECYLYFEKVK